MNQKTNCVPPGICRSLSALSAPLREIEIELNFNMLLHVTSYLELRAENSSKRSPLESLD